MSKPLYRIGNPVPDNLLLLRDRNLQRIGQVGRKQWKVESHYHRRSLAETAMFPFKTILGPNLASRTIERQKTEAAIGCLILNTFTQLRMPQSYKVVQNQRGKGAAVSTRFHATKPFRSTSNKTCLATSY